MRPEYHYEYYNEEGDRTRYINDKQLKYRIEFHGKRFINRRDAIRTLMSIEYLKEQIYKKTNCMYCCFPYVRCSCKKRKSVR